MSLVPYVIEQMCIRDRRISKQSSVHDINTMHSRRERMRVYRAGQKSVRCK